MSQDLNQTPITLAVQKISKDQLQVAWNTPAVLEPFHQIYSVFCTNTGLFLFHVNLPVNWVHLSDEEFTSISYENLFTLIENLS